MTCLLLHNWSGWTEPFRIGDRLVQTRRCRSCHKRQSRSL